MYLYMHECVMATPTFSQADVDYLLSAGAVARLCGRHVVIPSARWLV